MAKVLVGLLSYLAAVIVGAMSYILWLTLSDVLSGGTIGSFEFYPALFLITIVFGAGLALLPFLISIVILHRSGKTGWVAHVVAGVVTSFVALLTLGGVMRGPALFSEMPVLHWQELLDAWPIFLAGAVAGFAYWWVQRKLLWAMEQQRVA